jgi:hypothetical protein
MSSAATPTTTGSGRSREPSYPASPAYTTRDSYGMPSWQLRSASQTPERNRIW